MRMNSVLPAVLFFAWFIRATGQRDYMENFHPGSCHHNCWFSVSVVSRLSIPRCLRVRHAMSLNMLVTPDVLLYRRRYHRAARCCILSILYEPLFSTSGRGSQVLEQYSTAGPTKPL